MTSKSKNKIKFSFHFLCVEIGNRCKGKTYVNGNHQVSCWFDCEHLMDDLLDMYVCCTHILIN